MVRGSRGVEVVEKVTLRALEMLIDTNYIDISDIDIRILPDN